MRLVCLFGLLVSVLGCSSLESTGASAPLADPSPLLTSSPVTPVPKGPNSLPPLGPTSPVPSGASSPSPTTLMPPSPVPSMSPGPNINVMVPSPPCPGEQETLEGAHFPPSTDIDILIGPLLTGGKPPGSPDPAPGRESVYLGSSRTNSLGEFQYRFLFRSSYSPNSVGGETSIRGGSDFLIWARYNDKSGKVVLIPGIFFRCP